MSFHYIPTSHKAFTYDTAGIRSASICAWRLSPAVSAELRQQHLWSRPGEGLPHLSPQSHGIPTSVFCTEGDSEGEPSEKRCYQAIWNEAPHQLLKILAFDLPPTRLCAPPLVKHWGSACHFWQRRSCIACTGQSYPPECAWGRTPGHLDGAESTTSGWRRRLGAPGCEASGPTGYDWKAKRVFVSCSSSVKSWRVKLLMCHLIKSGCQKNNAVFKISQYKM